MSSGTSHKSLLETITLLYMLKECPESPKDYQQSNSLSVLSSIYQLPFQREKQIVENLAFLNKNKSMLITLLDTAIEDKSIQPSPKITVMELTDVLRKIKTLKALFMKFEDIQEHSVASSVVQDVAMELITQMHDLASQTKLKLALNSSKTLNPELKIFLPEAVEKLGRYYSISYELICVARSKEYSIFNSITIETSPTLRPPQPLKVDKNVHPLTTLQNILRPGSAVQSRSLKPSLERCLGKPIQVILDEFRLAIADYYKSVKVHAEIQLLFFYELHSERIRPRTICSSKSACYLCDLFFRLHGQYYVPRTHGRLCHRWTLPDWHTLLPEMRRQDFDILLRNFSDVLKVKVKVALDRGPVQANHPNKSNLIRSLSPITQSPDRVIPNCPISSEGPASLGFTRPDSLLSKPPSQGELRTDATSSSILPSTSTHYPQTQEPMTPREPPSREYSTSTPTATLQPVSPFSTASPTLDHELTEEEPIRRPISYPNISINIGTSRLNLHFSSDTTVSRDSDRRSSPSSRCLVRVKWLQGAETGNVDSQPINEEGLSYDTEMEFYHGVTSTPTELHLRRGEDFLSIKYAFDEPK
ncbi:MAG: hypothetical protein Q9172_002412 [Xanthocarpia lactea]